MSVSKVLLVSAALLSLAVLGTPAGEKYVPRPDEKLYGTWANEQNTYGGYVSARKIVNAPDGSYKVYANVADEAPIEEGTGEIDSTGTDSEGNTWYRIYNTNLASSRQYPGTRSQSLIRVSKDGMTRDSVMVNLAHGDFEPRYFPTEIDTHSSTYVILYRVEELHATWINRNMKPQKTSSFPGGYRDFAMMTFTKPAAEGTEEISRRWTDSAGDIWYETFGTVTSGPDTGKKFQALTRISKSWTVRETVSVTVGDFSPDGYPGAIDPQAASYRIYFRKGS
jgi:hypothetical protein